MLAACERILSAVDYMHKRRIVHCDLKLENLEFGIYMYIYICVL